MTWDEIDKTTRDLLVSLRKKATCCVGKLGPFCGPRIRFYFAKSPEQLVQLTHEEYKATLAHFQCGEQS